MNQGKDGCNPKNNIINFSVPKKTFWSIVLLSICINICGLTLPIYTIQAYDRIIVHATQASFLILTIGALFLIALEFVMKVLRSYIIHYSSSAAKHTGFNTALDRFPIIHPKFLSTMSSSEKQNVLDNISRKFDWHIQEHIIASTDLVFLGLMLITLAILSIKIMLTLLLVLIIFTTLCFLANKNIVDRVSERIEADKERYEGLSNLLGSLVLLRYTGNENQAIHYAEKIEAKTSHSTYKVSKAIARIYNFSHLTTQLSMISVIAIGAPAVINGELSLGTFIACIIIAGRATNPIKKALMMFLSSTNNSINDKSINSFFNHETRKTYAIKSQTSEVILTFEDISIDKDDEDSQTSKIDITIEGKQCIAIQSKTSYLKKRFVDLVMGSTVSSTGNVKFNGTKTFDISSEELPQCIGYIDLSINIYQGTIQENIAGFRNIPSDKIIEVTKTLGIHDQIISLSQGYNTMLSREKNTHVNSSLLVFIAIARTLLPEPSVIMCNLYEAVIDRATYQRVFRLLCRLSKTKAMILFTSDHNFLHLADHVFELTRKGLSTTNSLKMNYITKKYITDGLTEHYG